MAGALTEGAFVTKLAKAGFEDIEVCDRRPTGLDELAAYPLFTTELLGLMRDLMDPATQAEVGVAVVFRARLRGAPDTACAAQRVAISRMWPSGSRR